MADVEDGWYQVKLQLLNRHPETSNFVPYYDETWIPGSYDIDLWNCHTQTLVGLSCSNNTSEGGNNDINVAFGCSKPSIWKCLDKINEFQVPTDFDMEVSR